jgi:predicted DNA-binding transcriptional regulator AlpA
MKKKEIGAFVGITEAGAMLGWSKQQVTVYIKRGKFPIPMFTLACGKIWTKSQIEEYIENRKAKKLNTQ